MNGVETNSGININLSDIEFMKACPKPQNFICVTKEQNKTGYINKDISKRQRKDFCGNPIKIAENGTDKVKIKREKILVYKETHEFFLFEILALDVPLYTISSEF